MKNKHGGLNLLNIPEDKENKRGHYKIGWFLGMHEMQISEEISICKTFNS